MNGHNSPQGANLVALAAFIRQFDATVTEADLLTQDDSAADRPTAGVGEFSPQGVPEPESPVRIIVSGPGAGALTRPDLDDSAADRPTAGATSAEMAGESPRDDGSPVCDVKSRDPQACAAPGDTGAQGHTQPSAPSRAHTSGGLAPDITADPSAVDVPVAPCEGD